MSKINDIVETANTFINADHEWTTICCSHCGDTFKVPIYCGDRFCYTCSPRRLARTRRRLTWLSDQAGIPFGMGFKFLTLTIRSEDDLPGMIKSLLKSFRRMRQRAFWKNNVDGGAFIVEIKRGSFGWHAHVHAVIVANYLDFDKVKALWRKVSTGHGVDIRAKSSKESVNYMCKYMSKPNLDDESIEEINGALKGTRLFSPFGTWYALNGTYEQAAPSCQKCGFQGFIPLMYLDTPRFSTNVPDP